MPIVAWLWHLGGSALIRHGASSPYLRDGRSGPRGGCEMLSILCAKALRNVLVLAVHSYAFQHSRAFLHTRAWAATRRTTLPLRGLWSSPDVKSLSGRGPLLLLWCVRPDAMVVPVSQAMLERWTSRRRRADAIHEMPL